MNETARGFAKFFQNLSLLLIVHTIFKILFSDWSSFDVTWFLTWRVFWIVTLNTITSFIINFEELRLTKPHKVTYRE